MWLAFEHGSEDEKTSYSATRQLSHEYDTFGAAGAGLSPTRLFTDRGMSLGQSNCGDIRWSLNRQSVEPKL